MRFGAEGHPQLKESPRWLVVRWVPLKTKPAGLQGCICAATDGEEPAFSCLASCQNLSCQMTAVFARAPVPCNDDLRTGSKFSCFFAGQNP